MDNSTYSALFPSMYDFAKDYSADEVYRRQMEADPEYQASQVQGQNNQVPYNAPAVQMGGALDQGFSNYQMTPGSQSVKDSGHWNYYQDQEFEYVTQKQEEQQEADESVNDPGSKLARSTSQYRREGLSPRKMPTMDPKLQAQLASEEQGKQVMFDQNKIPKWDESQAFGQGLLSFGLNLLAGNDIATAFNQAGSHFQSAYGREKRELWAQDLVSQGFDAHEIQAWIETGDQKALSDPMEKKARMQQYRLGQANLQKAMFESSPDYLEWQAERAYNQDARADRQLELSEMSTLAGLDANRESTRLAREKFEYEKKKDANAKGYKQADSRDVILSAMQSGTNLGLANTALTTKGGTIAKLAGESPVGGHLIDQGLAGEDAQANKKVITERKNFVQGPLRMATGAAYGPSEIDDYTTALFPTGSDYSRPDIIRRKMFMQDVVMGVSTARATGLRNNFLDMTGLKKAADDVASGQAKPIKSKSTGMIVGVAYANGRTVQF